MARMLRPIATSVLPATLSSPGCSPWRQRPQADADSTGNPSSPGDGSLIQGGLQDLTNAPANGWNLRSLGW